MAEVSDLVFQGMSISDVCKKMNYDTEKENIILLIFAREYYIQQNYELGDKCLKRVEKVLIKHHILKSYIQRQ